MSQEKRQTIAVMVCDLRSAREVNDARIETLVQGLLTKGLKQAELRSLSFEEVSCAFIEATARVLAGPMLANGICDGEFDTVERIASQMGENLRGRMVDRCKGLAPGEDEIGETKGAA